MTLNWSDSNQADAERSEKAEPDYDDHSLGTTLRYLRGDRSLRKIQEATGITYSYLSDIERGNKRPGENVLSRLAEYHNVPLGELLGMAGLAYGADADRYYSNADIRRSFQFVLDDPSLGAYQKPVEDVPIETQRFVVQIYEHYTGKRILE